MSAVFSLVLLAGLVFLLQVATGSRDRRPYLVNHALSMGLFFLPLGYLLGPEQASLVSEDALASFRPLFALVVGWVGLILGLQLNVRELRAFPLRWFGFVLGEAALTFVVAWGLFAWAHELPGVPPLAPRTTLALALLVACISPTPLFLYLRFHRIVSRRAQLLRFLSTFNNVVMIVGFAALRALTAPEPAATGAPAAPGLGLVTGLSVVAGIFFVAVGRARLGVPEGFALILGMVLLVSGLASATGLSSLYLNLIVGAVIGNLSGRAPALFALLARYEKHLYVALLLLAGLSTRVLGGGGAWVELRWLLLSLVVLPLARAAGGLLLRLELPSFRLGGLALVARGGLAVALVMDMQGWLTPQGADVAMAVATGGVVVTNLLAPALYDAIGLEEVARR